MTVRLVEAVVRRGDFTLSVDTQFDDGVVTAILGPNGSGKSTLLRTVAGLEAVDRGSVSIDGTIVDAVRTPVSRATFVEPRRRDVGVVFQDYALFPHLSVRQNVAFGPRSRGAGRSAARAQADAVLDRLGVADLADRRPAALSGGQAQRVALARALATSPRALLLDEPLAALDAQVKDDVRAQLASTLRGVPGTTLLVTHDPFDALVLADRVVVVEDGAVVQDGAPADLTRAPGTSYVAALVGVTLLRGVASAGVIAVDGGGSLQVADQSLSGPALCVVRPESVTVGQSPPEGSARNRWPGTVVSVQPSLDRVRVVVDGAPSVVAAVTPGAAAELALAPGSRVWVSVKATDLTAYPAPSRSSQ